MKHMKDVDVEIFSSLHSACQCLPSVVRPESHLLLVANGCVETLWLCGGRGGAICRYAMVAGDDWKHVWVSSTTVIWATSSSPTTKSRISFIRSIIHIACTHRVLLGGSHKRVMVEVTARQLASIFPSMRPLRWGAEQLHCTTSWQCQKPFGFEANKFAATSVPSRGRMDSTTEPGKRSPIALEPVMARYPQGRFIKVQVEL